MNSTTTKYFRVLAISPSTSGFGFVILEGNDVIADSGAKSARQNKNDWCVQQVDKLIRKYEPDALILYDHAKNERRSERIKALNQRFVDLAKTHKLHVKLFSRERVNQVFFADAKGTKHEIATMLAQRLPDELASKLPPKRREWDSEDRRMDIFDAMALAVTFRQRKK